jgi:hypothetical protein
LEILLNGETLDIDGVNDTTTVLELILEVEKALKGTERVVVDVILDGTWHAPDEKAFLSSSKLVSFGKIELGAASAREMVIEGFKDALEGLLYAESLIESVASDLRLGLVKDGMVEYINFMDAVEWMVAMLKNADKAFASNMAESSLGLERENLLRRLTEQVMAVEVAQVHENWVDVADILEYEFTEIFVDVKEFVKKILG